MSRRSKLAFRLLTLTVLMSLLLGMVLTVPASAGVTCAWIQGTNDDDIAIPDNDGWVTSTIVIPDLLPLKFVASLSVDIIIQHTWQSDLQVQLISPLDLFGLHPWTIWDRDGDSTDDIYGSFSTDMLNGALASGKWRLRVRDRAGADVGYIDKWTITICPAPEAIFTGGVFVGEVGDMSQPLGDVDVQLYGTYGNDRPGKFLGASKTVGDGSFSISGPMMYTHYSLVVVPPAGYTAVGNIPGLGAEAEWCPEGILFDLSVLQALCLQGSDGNAFFLAGSPLMPAEPEFTFGYSLNGYTGVVDTTIDEWNPDANMEKDSLHARNLGVKGMLFNYDLSIIPAEATITQATLNLHLVRRTNAGNLTLGAFELLRPWDVGAATWGMANGTDAWEVAGAKGATDVADTATSTAVVPGALDSIVSLDLTALVQKWVADPATNNGVYVTGVAGDSTEAVFASSEHYETGYRPQLYVAWTLPTE